ncbi:MFS transporter [Streptomyces nanshensis]|uniref:MFS transporter n=1 Tax=Streptomyces nanshensis TaxID=518642 RepID=UPI00085C4B4E|nr:MFS transporter [Streptomyces nanshensis]
MTATPAAEGANSGWGAVLRARHARHLLTSTLIGRLPQGMMVIVIVLAVRADGGSYSWGAELAAAYGLAFAAGQPLLGRVVDYHGQTLPIVGGALIAAMASAVLAMPGVVLSAAAMVLVIVAGVSSPPLEGSMRVLWRTLVPAHRLPSAYSIDNAAQEMAHVVAPLAVGGAVTLGGPNAALMTMALLGVGGASAMAVSPPSRAWRSRRRSTGALGALRLPGMGLLLLTLVAVGGSVGAFFVGASIASEQLGAGWVAWAAPMTLSLGAIGGNALYGPRQWTLSVRRQLMLAASGFAAGWVPLTFAYSPATAIFGAFLAGILFGPLQTIAFQAIDLLVPRDLITEAYSWLVAAIGIGISCGSYLAGAHSMRLGTIPLLAGLLTALLARTLNRPLQRAEDPAASAWSRARRSTETPAPSSVSVRARAGHMGVWTGSGAPLARVRRYYRRRH